MLNTTHSNVSILTERCAELRGAYRALPELSNQIKHHSNDNFKTWETEVAGQYPNFHLKINLHPHKGVHIIDNTNPIIEKFDGKQFNGYPVRVEYKNNTNNQRKSQDIRNQDRQTWEKKMLNPPTTLYATREFLDSVKKLRSLPTHEQIEHVRHKEKDGYPYSTDEAVATGLQILKLLPFSEQTMRGAAMPRKDGGLQIEWVRRGHHAAIIAIEPDGKKASLYISVDEKNIDIKSALIPIDDFFKYLSEIDTQDCLI